jgi:hypothetical protein
VWDEKQRGSNPARLEPLGILIDHLKVIAKPLVMVKILRFFPAKVNLIFRAN